MHEVLVNRLGGLSLPRKSVVRLTDRPDMTLDVYRDVKQQCNNNNPMLRFFTVHRTSQKYQCTWPRDKLVNVKQKK